MSSKSKMNSWSFAIPSRQTTAFFKIDFRNFTTWEVCLTINSCPVAAASFPITFRAFKLHGKSTISCRLHQHEFYFGSVANWQLDFLRISYELMFCVHSFVMLGYSDQYTAWPRHLSVTRLRYFVKCLFTQESCKQIFGLFVHTITFVLSAQQGSC